MNARYSRCSGRTGESFDNGRDTTETTSRNVSALVYLHTRDKPTVHRDIKPSNILVSYRDPHGDASLLYIKLSDFGLAKEGSVKSKCGTELYMAPETLKTRTPGYYSPAVDIWSLGVIVLECSHGLPSSRQMV
jgi:serine/threonine protein kinase